MSIKLIQLLSGVFMIITGIFAIIGSCTGAAYFYMIAASGLAVSGVLTVLANILKGKK